MSSIPLRTRAKIASLLVFFCGLAMVIYLNAWWPGIMLAVGFPLAIWQCIQKRFYDMGVTLFVFIGAFATVQFQIKWQVILPILFAIGGIYIVFREWIESKDDDDKEEDP